MNSPFANLYLSILERLLTITTGDPAKPVIRYIDLDYSQLEHNERPAVDFPCVLIDFTDFQFTELSQKAQEATGIIRLKLVTDPYDETDSNTPDTYKKAALAILDMEYQIYRKLHGWNPVVAVNGSGEPTQLARPLVRVNVTSDNRRPGLKVRPMAYQCAFTDYSAKTARQTANPTITTNSQFQQPT